MKINDLFRLICRLSLIVFLGSLPVSASAEIIDDMTVRADANGEVDLVVKFAFQIQYLRNFPEGKTDYTAIYFNPLSSVPFPTGKTTHHIDHRPRNLFRMYRSQRSTEPRGRRFNSN